MTATLRPVRPGPEPDPMPLLPLELARVVASTPVERSLRRLARTLTGAIGASGLDIKPAFTEPPDQAWHRAGAVVDAEGKIRDPDSRQWAQAHIDAAGGDLARAGAAMKATRCMRTMQQGRTAYLVARTGPRAADQIQVRVDIVEEHLGPLLPEDLRWCSASDLVHGPTPRGQDLQPWAPSRYELRDIVDIRAFVERAALVHRGDFYERLSAAAGRTVTQVFVDTGERRVLPLLEHPGFPKTPPPCRLHRLFADWDASSAGANANIEDHWVLQLQYGTSQGREYCDAIPRWVTRKRLACAHKARLRSNVALLDWLDRFDARAGHPFAWFFYGVHGNRLDADHIQRVGELLADHPGLLAERDAQVVRSWMKQPYGF